MGVRELRSNLAMYLRAAGNGNRIVVTQSGDAIAELGPLGGAQAGGTQTDGTKTSSPTTDSPTTGNTEAGGAAIGTQINALAPEVLAAVGLAEPPRDRTHSRTLNARSPKARSPETQDAGTHDAEPPSAVPIQLPVGVSCSAVLADLRGTYTRRGSPRATVNVSGTPTPPVANLRTPRRSSPA